MNIKLLGPEYAAKQMWREGQSTESNPFTKGTIEHSRFDNEIRKLERNELIQMMGPHYA